LQRLTSFDGLALAADDVLGMSSESRVALDFKLSPRLWRVKVLHFVREFVTNGFGIPILFGVPSSDELKRGLESIICRTSCCLSSGAADNLSLGKHYI
jgi:hypothetical protein